MEEFEIFKSEVKERLLRMYVLGGELSEREKAVLSIVWKNRDEIDQNIYNYMASKAIDEAGGCSTCGDLTGFNCICEWEQEQEDFDLEEAEIEFFNN